MNFKIYLVEQTNNLIKEAFVGNNIKFYTTTKDDMFEIYFSKKELRFANNAGNMYGLGIYTTLEAPKDSKVGYSNAKRTALYGNNIYELSTDASKIFYFLYDWFVKSPLYSILNSSEETFIKDQFEYFNIKMPTVDELFNMTPSSTITCGKCAFNFYKYMYQLYYQRKDGTLNSPVTGFIYFGKNDGLTGVIWSPYKCELTRKSINDGQWEEINVTADFNDDENDIEERIFAGNMTDEKIQIYKLLMGYKGEYTPLGQFTDIVIYDNKTIDATYKSNIPQVDGYRHCFLIMDNPYISNIIKKGYKFNKINGWIKLGNSTQANGQTYLPSEAPKILLPNIVTEGIYLTGMDITDNEIKACKNIKTISNTLVIRKSNIHTSNLEYENVYIKDSIIDDEIFDNVVKKYNCVDKNGNLSVIKKSETDKLSKKKGLKKNEI